MSSFIWVWALVGISAQSGAGPAAGVAGELYRSVFYPSIAPVPTRLDALSPVEQTRVRQYAARARRFRSLLPDTARGHFPETALLEKRRNVERALVSLIAAAGIERLARDYAREAVLYYEWEGMSEGPLAETRFAEEYLRNHPGSPLEPYLHLFIAARLRSASECPDLAGRAEARNETLRGYRDHLNQALKNSDPLIRLIATGMDQQAYLYVGPKP